jgi:curved DNA-binding protein
MGLGGDIFSRFFGGGAGGRGGGFRTYTFHGNPNQQQAGRAGWDFGGAQAAPVRGQDLIYELPVSLEEVFHGAEKAVSYRRGGKMERVSVKVPQGIATGKKLRLAGKGEPSPAGGGAPGDLLIRVAVMDHPAFKRDGNDLETEVDVPFSQAALGTSVSVATLDGKNLTVKVPGGTQSGSKLRLKGQGLPHLKGGSRGDLLVKINVPIPKKLSKEQKELLSQMAEKGL